MLDPPSARAELEAIRAATDRPVNLNFFCHAEPVADDVRHRQWRSALSPYYAEFGLTVPQGPPSAGRSTFGEAQCEIVEALRMAERWAGVVQVVDPPAEAVALRCQR